MNFKEFVAGPDDNERRIDKIIRKFCPEISLSSIYKYLRKGLIKVNNKKISQDYRVCTQDKILIADFILNSPESDLKTDYKIDSKNDSKTDRNEKAFEKTSKTTQLFVPYSIIVKNQDFLVINKPYDLVVHRKSNDRQKSLEEIVKNQFLTEKKSSTENSLSFSPGPLHRLDKKTTGLLVFSQSLNGARTFSENLQNHFIQKKYIGIVQGKLLKTENWTDEIGKTEQSDEKKTFHTVTSDSDSTKTALTFATPLFYGKYKGTEITIVEFYIKTGRTHQIRFQSSKHGFPLLGDTAYGGKKLEKESRDFYLHAQKLIFTKEINNLPSELICKIDKDFNNFITKTCGKTEIGL